MDNQPINKIDNAISKQLFELSVVIDELNFESKFKFRITDSNPEFNFGDEEFSGIYLFEIKKRGHYKTFKEWSVAFTKKWEAKKYLKKHCPVIAKGRLKKHGQLDEWIPLYIGKSNNVYKRVDQHLNKELNSTTYALKLMARENLKEDEFRVSIIRFDIDNYDTIMPFIENKMRERYNPIIGKQ